MLFQNRVLSFIILIISGCKLMPLSSWVIFPAGCFVGSSQHLIIHNMLLPVATAASCSLLLFCALGFI